MVLSKLKVAIKKSNLVYDWVETDAADRAPKTLTYSVSHDASRSATSAFVADSTFR